MSAKVPMNSAISFCDMVYIRKSPGKDLILLLTRLRCARFERLHSSRNAAGNASFLQEFRKQMNWRLWSQRRQPDFLQKHGESRIVLPRWIHVRACANADQASVALLVSQLEGGEAMV